MITLAQAVSEIAPLVGRGGSCDLDDLLRLRVNEAVSRLLDFGDWVDTVVKYRLYTQSGCLTLPNEVDSIRAVNIDGRRERTLSQWFEFLGQGPGLLNANCGCLDRLADAGTSPVIYDVCGCQQLLVASDREEDEGTLVHISGMDCMGNTVRNPEGCYTEFDTGETLDLHAEHSSVYTANKFKTITALTKSITKGMVFVWGYDPCQSMKTQLVAILRPNETEARFKRYYLSGCDEDEHLVTLIAKTRFLGAYYPGDLLPVSVYAIKQAVMAIEAEEAHDFASADEHLKRALQILDNQIKNRSRGYLKRINVDVRGPGYSGRRLRGIV